MLLVWIPVSVLAMYFILNMVYGRLWKKGLKAELRFGSATWRKATLRL